MLKVYLYTPSEYFLNKRYSDDFYTSSLCLHVMLHYSIVNNGLATGSPMNYGFDNKHSCSVPHFPSNQTQSRCPTRLRVNFCII